MVAVRLKRMGNGMQASTSFDKPFGAAEAASKRVKTDGGWFVDPPYFLLFGNQKYN